MGAQDDGVDEDADQPLQPGPFAAGDDGTHGHVVLPRPPVEQELAGGDQGHEQGPVAPPGKLGEPGGHIGRYVEGVQGAVLGLYGRPGTVGGQLQRGYAVELPAPVRHLPVERRSGQVLALPDREVGVLVRQVRQVGEAAPAGQIGPLSAHRRAVQGAQVVNEHADRPAVGDDVGHGEGERVLVGGQADQARPQQRPAPQVERARAVLGEDPDQFVLAVRRGPFRQVEHRQRYVPGRAHDLHGPSVHLVEGGAQRLVPGHQRGQRGGQRGQVEPAA